MCDDNVFDTPNIPEPPPATAPLPELDPEEAIRRRVAKQKDQVTRDSLVINDGMSNKGNKGTGLRIG